MVNINLSASQINQAEALLVSTATPPEKPWLHEPMSYSVLKLLFEKIEVLIPAGELKQACEQAQEGLGETPPVQRISLILKILQLKTVQPAQLRWSRFDQRRLPALIFFQDQWQMVERGKDEQLILTDADAQTQELGEDELEEGIVLWLRSTPKKEAKSAFSYKDNIAARMVLREVFKSRRWLVEVTIATVIINILAVTTSIFAMQVYDRVVPTLAYATLTTLVMGMAIVVGLDWGLKRLRAKTLDSLSCAVDKAVTQQVFDHVMKLQLDIRPKSLGTLAAQVGGLDAVRQFFTSGVVFALVDMPFALLFIAFIAIIGGKIGWVYLIVLPVAMSIGFLTQKRLKRLLREQMIRSNERQGLLVDAIQGTESIRSNNATWRFSEQWKDITATISRYNIQQKSISNLATVSTASLGTIAYITALVVGVGQIEAGNITMGAMIACSILGGRVIGPVSQGVQHLANWQNISQALDMVSQVLSLDTERSPDQTLLIPDEIPQTLELEAVRFSYEGSPVQQLKIDTLKFKAGDKVALLGPIGGGKSTLLKVLAGLYKPSAGRIRLGNADLWELDPNAVADNISYLPQSVHLFKGTLRSNLILSGAVGDSHILQVCEQLGINNIAAGSPQGMDLAISEGGDGLSGGQRQLLGLARVFLAQPKIWLLDEPTSSLDMESEKRVLDAIKANVKDDDILVIASHRPALAAQVANRVLIVQGGEIVADGKPENIIPNVMKNQSRTGLKDPQGPLKNSLDKGAGHVV